MKKLFVLLFIAVAIPCAAVPQRINYQGNLTRTNGAPLDTTVAMTFRIYAISYGGDMLWMETHPSVAVGNGLFNVLLGSVTPLTDLFDADRWLEIQVGSDLEMTPRQQIVSVAHAYRVGTVGGASGGTITGDVNILGKGNVGTGNVNSGVGAFVAGINDTASGDYTIVGGGLLNRASAEGAVVDGGVYNTASGIGATVGGGVMNTASTDNATVGGGVMNTAASDGSVISGGSSNTTSGVCASVGGGAWNTASGVRSTVPGGHGNTAAGDYSFAAGFAATAGQRGAFVWGTSSLNSPTTSFGDHTVTFRCENGARFYTHPFDDTGISLPAGGGAWAPLCDANQKNFHGGVNTSDILQKVSALPLHRWSYKSQKESIHHIGPTSQDFYSAFGLGDNNTTISTLDPDGIALAAIQALYKEVIELRSRVQTLEAGQQQGTKEDK